MFCLGATKAGTSWLYDHLAVHPQCRFRRIKELQYFNLTEPGYFDSAIEQTKATIADIDSRLGAVDPATAARMTQRIDDLNDWLAVLDRREIDLDAYRAFLTADLGDARLVGDITPGYSLLPGKRLRALRDVAHDTRFVYLMRDPLSRLWSHVRMVANRTAKPQDFERAAIARLENLLSASPDRESQWIAERGDYARILPKLDRVYPAKRLLVLFQEEMMTLPGMKLLWSFLGLDPAPVDLERRVHEGRAFALPTDLRARALAWLRPQYDFVAANMLALPKQWQKNMEEGFA